MINGIECDQREGNRRDCKKKNIITGLEIGIKKSDLNVENEKTNNKNRSTVRRKSRKQ